MSKPECETAPANAANFTCIICPNSCRLAVWKDEQSNEIHVIGHTCKRGIEYGKNEFSNPVRMVITTMRIEHVILPVIPVRSNNEVPKGKLFDVIGEISKTKCVAPVKMGQVLIPNVLGTGVDIIASRDMKAAN